MNKNLGYTYRKPQKNIKNRMNYLAEYGKFDSKGFSRVARSDESQ